MSRLCVFGGLWVDMWRLVHQWSFFAVFTVFWRLVHYWYSLGRPVTIGTVMVKNSQETVKTAKMTIGVPIVTCRLRVRRIHKATCLHIFQIFTARCVCKAQTLLSQDVCLTITGRYCIETGKHIIKIFHRRVGTPFYSSFSLPKLMAIFRGRRMQVRYEKSLFPTNIWLYLGNDTRRGHCYYGMPIGTHMRTTEWCYFQWPWVS